MNGATDGEQYGFGSLPLDPVRPGTTLLLSGSAYDGARELAYRLLAGDDDAALFVTLETSAKRLLNRVRDATGSVPTRVGVVDCVGDRERVDGASVHPVSRPDDLTGIGIRYSSLYQRFAAEGARRVRTGFHTVSTLYTYADYRPASRFVHTVAGRVETVDGLGVFVADPGALDERTLTTVGNFCDGRIDVRDEGDGPELRVRGLPDQSRDWRPFEP